MSRRHLMAVWVVMFLLAMVVALIVTAEQPPRPACSDAYDPACATTYVDQGGPG